MPYPDRGYKSNCCRADIVLQKHSTFEFYQCEKCKEEVTELGYKPTKDKPKVEQEEDDWLSLNEYANICYGLKVIEYKGEKFE